MQTAIQVVWWVGLLGALGATVALVKNALLLLWTIRGIERLAIITRDAARGMAGNLEEVRRLDGARRPAHGFSEAAGHLDSAIQGLEQRLEALGVRAKKAEG
jgi:hypothetical protein